MVASGRSEIEEGLVSIEIFHHSFKSVRRGSDTETVEKEEKWMWSYPGGDWSMVSKRAGRRRTGTKKKTIETGS